LSVAVLVVATASCERNGLVGRAANGDDRAAHAAVDAHVAREQGAPAEPDAGGGTMGHDEDARVGSGPAGATSVVQAAPQPPKDPERPSDDAPGLPGYLLDPSEIVVATSGGQTTLTVRPGALGGASGASVPLFAGTIGAPEFEHAFAATSGTVRLKIAGGVDAFAATVGATTTHTLAVAADDVLVITGHRAAEDAATLLVPPLRDKPIDAGFVDLARGGALRALGGEQLATARSSAFCAVGKIDTPRFAAGTWLLVRRRLVHDEGAHCSDCDLAQALPADHPLATPGGLLKEGHPCRIARTPAPVVTTDPLLVPRFGYYAYEDGATTGTPLCETLQTRCALLADKAAGKFDVAGRTNARFHGFFAFDQLLEDVHERCAKRVAGKNVMIAASVASTYGTSYGNACAGFTGPFALGGAAVTAATACYLGPTDGTDAVDEGKVHCARNPACDVFVEPAGDCQSGAWP
jgi:hypothetical protein